MIGRLRNQAGTERGPFWGCTRPARSCSSPGRGPERDPCRQASSRRGRTSTRDRSRATQTRGGWGRSGLHGHTETGGSLRRASETDSHCPVPAPQPLPRGHTEIPVLYTPGQGGQTLEEFEMAPWDPWATTTTSTQRTPWNFQVQIAREKRFHQTSALRPLRPDSPVPPGPQSAGRLQSRSRESRRDRP